MVTVDIDAIKMRCHRCKHEWIPRHSDIKVCPNCKSPYWNNPKKSEK